jgi:hypothetical protein
LTILDVLGILRGVTTDSYGERGGVWWGGESQRVACIEFDREILAWRPTTDGFRLCLVMAFRLDQGINWHIKLYVGVTTMHVSRNMTTGPGSMFCIGEHVACYIQRLAIGESLVK